MEQIGRYRILGELGRGAMGVVYRAEDPTIGRIVAIKTIRLKDATSEEEHKFLQDRLFREARSAGMLSHPNIVTIYDVSEQDGVFYIFMEYVDGPTLEQLLRRGALAQRTVLDVLEQTGLAVDYAQSKGIVHRDIKPGNIMLASNGTVKITDFGVAKFVSQQATSSGVLLGTPSYMSPEQISEQPIDGRSDQFALAVIAYQLLTGERPFTAATVSSLMYKIVNEDPVPTVRINPTLNVGVDVVLRKALSKNSQERYATSTLFMRALSGALEASKNWKAMAAGNISSLETVGVDETDQPMEILDEGTVITPPIAKNHPWGMYVVAAVTVLFVLWTLRSLLFRSDSGKLQTEAENVPAANNSDKPSAAGPLATTQAPLPARAPQNDDDKKGDTPSPTPAQPQTKAPVDEPRPPVPPSPPKTDSAEYDFRVVTSPPGAKVMFDGQPKLICTSPCSMKLGSGRHTVVAIMDGFKNHPRIFNLPADSEVVISMERSFGTLVIRSTPAGATIILDGVERRERTPAVITIGAGKHRVEVAKEGLKKEDQTVEIREGGVTNIDITWP